MQSGVYYMDSLYISNGGQIVVPSTGNVVIYVLDQGSTATPLNIDGGTVANGGGNPNNFSVVYNGAKTVNLANGAAMFATVYAPNAPVTVSGNAGVYGAVVGKTYAFSGSGHINYDTNLKTQTPHVTLPPGAGLGPIHIDQFSWSAYYQAAERICFVFGTRKQQILRSSTPATANAAVAGDPGCAG
jgi:hypothetical protein